jgi:hypothetical protein
VGRQYGSEGKGNIAGHIAPGYDLLLGAGAGGHVEAHDGRVAWIEIFHNGRYTLGGQSDVRRSASGSVAAPACPRSTVP